MSRSLWLCDLGHFDRYEPYSFLPSLIPSAPHLFNIYLLCVRLWSRQQGYNGELNQVTALTELIFILMGEGRRRQTISHNT